MSVSNTVIETQVGRRIVVQNQPGGGLKLTGAETISSSPTRYHAIVIDNSLNLSSSYLKMWLTDPGAAIGTGAAPPEMILVADAATKVQYSFDTGVAMSGSYAAILSSNGTSGDDTPASSVTVVYMLST